MSTRSRTPSSRPPAADVICTGILLLTLIGPSFGAGRMDETSSTVSTPAVDGFAGIADGVPTRPCRGTVVLWSDDMEGGENGWTHRDHGWGVDPHFHVTTYMAYEGDHSWWCGGFAYDTDGGYGNGWDDRLELPSIDISGASYPILTFAHYFHSEPTRDSTVLQGMRGGVLDDLNAGFDGLIPGGGWVDIGTYGYVLSDLDNPLEIRFRFTSDGLNSDEDGGFDSLGGGYMVDNIKVFDFYGGEVLFLDDVESGGLCNPNVQTLAGDYWHIIERPCAATSDSHVWWCGDDSDTTRIPGHVDNWLISPAVDVSQLDHGTPCTLRYMLHAEVPTVDNDYWTIYASTDDGTTWYQLGAWWGDAGACSGWSQAGVEGLDVSHLLPGESFRALFRFLTTADGCGPGAAGGAGITLDDVSLLAGSSSVEPTSWGMIKAAYRTSVR